MSVKYAYIAVLAPLEGDEIPPEWLNALPEGSYISSSVLDPFELIQRIGDFEHRGVLDMTEEMAICRKISESGPPK